MGLFKHLEGQVAILVEGGVYKQAELFSRDGYLYAKAGSGFVRLYADGSTTKAKCRIDALHFDKALFQDKFGRLGSGEIPSAKPLGDGARLLLGSV